MQDIHPKKESRWSNLSTDPGIEHCILYGACQQCSGKTPLDPKDNINIFDRPQHAEEKILALNARLSEILDSDIIPNTDFPLVDVVVVSLTLNNSILMRRRNRV